MIGGEGLVPLPADVVLRAIFPALSSPLLTHFFHVLPLE